MVGRVFDALHELGHLNALQALDNQLLIAMYGTQYQSSNSIHCEQYSVTQHKGQITYSHCAVMPVIVAAGRDVL